MGSMTAGCRSQEHERSSARARPWTRTRCGLGSCPRSSSTWKGTCPCRMYLIYTPLSWKVRQIERAICMFVVNRTKLHSCYSKANRTKLRISYSKANRRFGSELTKLMNLSFLLQDPPGRRPQVFPGQCPQLRLGRYPQLRPG
jgi:hypothetical protein